MRHYVRFCNTVIFVLLQLYLNGCTSDLFKNIDSKYYLASSAYNLTKDIFIQGRSNYDRLKKRSTDAIDTFLDLVRIMNDEMAKELRSAVIKFYKIKYFRDFTNYVISMEEMVDIIDHCLIEPIEKLRQVRNQFHDVIKNFEDVRNFDTVDKCHNELPDEVAAAHCLLHQAVLLNETMQESLVSIVEIKTRQHAQDMNITLYDVQKCLNDFVPKFYEQLLIDSYTNNCGYLKVVNASIADIVHDKWRMNQTLFPSKWDPLVKLLKGKLESSTRFQDPLLLMLFSANMTSQDILNTLYSTPQKKDPDVFVSL